MAIPLISGGSGASAPKIKVAPPANVKTGANPRGVAVVVPKIAPTRGDVAARPPRMLTTGANPRGVSLGLAPKVPTIGDVKAELSAAAKPPKLNLPPATGGAYRGLVPGAIRPAGFLGGAGNILGTLVSQIAHLPQTTLEGAIGLGQGVAHDITHGNVLKDIIDPYGVGYGSALLGGGSTALQSDVHAAVHSDPVYEAITQGSLRPLGANPLGTILDATGAYGLAGRGAGALMRSGALGDSARAAASLERPTLRLFEDGAGVQARAYSPNQFTKLAQQAWDRNAPGTKLGAAQVEHQLRRGVAADHAAESGVQQADSKLVTKAAQAYKPTNADSANAARFIIPYGTKGTGDIHAALQAFRDEIARGDGEVYGVTADNRDTVLKQLDHAIAHPEKIDQAGILQAAEGYGEVQRALEERMATLDTYTQEHLDNATRAQYMQQLPGVHYLDTPTKDPRLLGELKDARASAKAANAELKSAELRRAAYGGSNGTRGAYAGARSALTQVRQADPAAEVAAALRQAMNEAHPGVRATHDAEVALLRSEAQAAQKALSDAKAAVKSHKLQGTMIEDPSVPALKSGPLKGLSVRPITESDYQAALEHEPSGYRPSYLTARNLLRDRIQSLRETDAPALAEAGRAAVTGEAAKVGDLNPGWGGVVRSQLNTVNQLRVERELQNFMGQYADPRPFPTLKDAQREAQAYQADTRVPLTTITWKGAYRNVPTAALDELRKQFNADHPGAGMRLLTRPNRFFSRTVLAMSPKLPVMHSVENITRTALMEGAATHPLLGLRAIPDILRGRQILQAAERTDPELATRLRTLVTPGGLTHAGVGAVGEDAGKLPIEQAPLRAEAQRFAQAIGTVPNAIITLQRALEKPAQYAALGAHGRQLIQEWGHTWLEANAHVSKYTDALARGLADPAEAQRAAAWMHKVDGQYNAMTASARQALRFVPFGSWYVNAARLVMLTLPKDHPLFDALLQDTARHNQTQWNAEHAGLPSDMQATLPVGPNAYLDIGKFTPIGITNPDLQGVESTVSQLALPWVASPLLAALAAKGPFMTDLYGPTTPYGQSDQPAGSAANLAGLEQIAEEFGGPINDLARALYGHGGTFYSDQTPVLNLLGIGNGAAVKPGSTAQQRGFLKLPPAIDKVADPFHPTTFGGGSSAGASRALGRLPQIVGKLPAAEGHLPKLEGRP